MEILLLCTGVLFISAAIFLHRINSAYLFDTEKVDGEFFGFSYGQSSMNKKFIYPVYKYRTRENNDMLVESMDGVTVSPKKSIPIFIHKAEPHRAVLQNTTFKRYRNLFLICGSILVISFFDMANYNLFSILYEALIIAVFTFFIKKGLMEISLNQGWRTGLLGWFDQQIQKRTVSFENKDQIVWADEAYLKQMFIRFKRQRIWAFAWLILIVIFMFFMGAQEYRDTKRFFAIAQKTSGKIVELKRIKGDKSLSVTPVVEFLDGAGIVRRFKNPYTVDIDSYKLNQEVEIFYDPNRTAVGLLANDNYGYVLAYLAFGVGIVCLFILFVGTNAENKNMKSFG